MTVISLTVLMGHMKEAVKGGEKRNESDDSGHLGRPQEILGRAYCALALTTL